MSLRFEAWLGVVGITLWSILFGILSIPSLAQAWKAWLVFNAARQVGDPGYTLFVLMFWVLLAWILLSMAVRGTVLLLRVMLGHTSPRLARRDYWDAVPNSLFFIKTGLWKS